MYGYNSNANAMSILHDDVAFLKSDSSSGFTSCRINLVGRVLVISVQELFKMASAKLCWN